MHDNVDDNLTVTGELECYEPSLTASERVELLNLREIVKNRESTSVPNVSGVVGKVPYSI